MANKLALTESFSSRNRHYFLDYMRADNGSNYIRLARSDREESGTYQRSSVVVFEEDFQFLIQAFSSLLHAAAYLDDGDILVSNLKKQRKPTPKGDNETFLNPTERMELIGPSAMTDAELLAILIGAGNPWHSRGHCRNGIGQTSILGRHHAGAAENRFQRKLIVMEHPRIFKETLEIDGIPILHFFLCHYRAVRFGFDALSRSINLFKEGYDDSVHGWVDCAASAAHSISMDRGDILVRPMGHREKWVPADGGDKPLDWVCHAIAQATGTSYLPDLLEEKREVPALYGLGRQARREAVQGAYTIATGFHNRRFRRIWIVDDVLTTGAIVSEIARTLMDGYPKASISVFTLAKADDNPADVHLPSLYGTRYRWSSAGRWTWLGFRL